MRWSSVCCQCSKTVKDCATECGVSDSLRKLRALRERHFVPAPSTLAVNGSTLGTRRRRLPLDPRAHPSFASERTHEQRSASWQSLESFIQFTSFCSSCTLPDNSKIVFWSSMSFRLASVSNVELWKFS